MDLPAEATRHHTLTTAGVEIKRVYLKSEQEEADGVVVHLGCITGTKCVHSFGRH